MNGSEPTVRRGTDAARRCIAGEPLTPDEARAVLESLEARRLVAAEDPSALLDLLGALPPDPPPPPAPRISQLVGGARRRGRVARVLGTAAASLLAAAALVLAVRGPQVRQPPRLAEAREVRAEGERFVPGEAVSRVVRRLESDSARVVTVVPDSPEAPTVTLILDEEIDL